MNKLDLTGGIVTVNKTDNSNNKQQNFPLLIFLT